MVLVMVLLYRIRTLQEQAPLCVRSCSSLSRRDELLKRSHISNTSPFYLFCSLPFYPQTSGAAFGMLAADSNISEFHVVVLQRQRGGGSKSSSNGSGSGVYGGAGASGDNLEGNTGARDEL